jgi:hypothetical protein
MSLNKLFELAVKSINKPAVYVSNELHYTSDTENTIWSSVIEEARKMYGTKTNEYHDILSGLVNSDVFFFDTEEEQQKFLNVFANVTEGSGIYLTAYSADGICID